MFYFINNCMYGALIVGYI